VRLPFLAAYLGTPDRSSFPSPPPEVEITTESDPDQLAAWARSTAAACMPCISPAVDDAVGVVTRALVADALTKGRPPMSVRVAVTDTAVDVAVTGGRGIAERTLSNDAPALVQARRLTTRWTTGLGPGRRGSVVTASVPLRRRRRFARLLRGGR
jgi:hypothetical protein